MPLYVFCCEKCRTTFEETRPVAERENPAKCPHCGGPAKLTITATRGVFPGAGTWRGGL